MHARNLLLLSIALAVVGGCDSSPTSSADSVATGLPAGGEHGHDHSHGESAEDHSVAGHDHGAGPHDGVITDWGGGTYHVELLIDHDQQQATAYVLGGDEKTPSPIAAESIELSIRELKAQVTLKADPQTADPAGSASRFVGQHESLGTVQDYSGTITGVVEGTPYSGDFKEETHDH